MKNRQRILFWTAAALSLLVLQFSPLRLFDRSVEVDMIDDLKLGDSITVFDYARGKNITVKTVKKSPQQWKESLTPAEYNVLRDKGTERAFTGAYYDNKTKGLYRCAGCGNDLFHSETKYESGTGWPSYWKPVAEANIAYVKDSSLGTVRTEVVCARCGGHLGHVFEDGPEPTGLRYCLNSVSLDFVEEAEVEPKLNPLDSVK